MLYLVSFCDATHFLQRICIITATQICSYRFVLDETIVRYSLFEHVFIVERFYSKIVRECPNRIQLKISVSTSINKKISKFCDW